MVAGRHCPAFKLSLILGARAVRLIPSGVYSGPHIDGYEAQDIVGSRPESAGNRR
jgi:hypothetical protein